MYPDFGVNHAPDTYRRYGLMDRKTLQEALRLTAYPVLRKAGFKGSGVTLRRVVSPVIHVFNVQGSQWGGGFYLNLGVHLEGLPTISGQPTNGKPTEYDCLVRRRLEPPEDYGRGAWPYGASEDEATTVSEVVASQFQFVGESFFSRYTRYPDDFESMIEAATAEATGPPGIPLIQLAFHLGKVQEANALIQTALEAAPPSATGFRARLEELLRCQNASGRNV
ncbi:MAG: DUF4304 domain-containing protein [Thermoanaerobaculia bacterium]|nr:DUF4304 domain-containing protein [Thermoanaerobaculia bacterium]